MLLSTAFTLLALTAPTTPKPAQPPSLEVVINGGLLFLPPLPANSDQAVLGNKKIQVDLQKGIADIEAHLNVLYPLLAQEPPLSPSLGVPKDQAEEARFFASMLNDEKATALEGRILEAWNAWQAAFVNSGVASSLGDPAALQQSADAQQKSARLAMELRRTKSSPEMVKSDQAFVLNRSYSDVIIKHRIMLRARRTEWRTIEFDNANHAASQESEQKARIHAVATKQQALELAPLWNPLAEHLNAQATKLMDYERPATNAPPLSIKALRLQGKICFLERYRHTMWICGVFWAQMASGEVPAPLKQLP